MDDGCDLDFAADPTPDDELDLVVLFAGAEDPDALAAEWRELFGP